MNISEEIERESLSKSEVEVVSSQENIYGAHLSSDEALARQLQAFENILIGTSDREFHEIHSMEFPGSNIGSNLEPLEERALDIEPSERALDIKPSERALDIESNRGRLDEHLPDIESSTIPLEATRQDNINPDNMSYEELRSLGEVVGKENKGLPEDLISYLPVSKYRTAGFFSRNTSEECVVCKRYYKSGERLIKLPCQHRYHADCITHWLQINKACPVCNEEVFG